MLILTRKIDDSIIIEVEGQAEPIEIKITEMSASQVRLGITAPKGCRIWRSELMQTVQSNRQAATTDVPAERMRDILKNISGAEGGLK